MKLPPCPYRGPEKNGKFTCAAANGQPVTPQDCMSCAIPEALAHNRACLYLVPLRHRGQAAFVCRAVSPEESVFAVKNWRHLCFCRYWFPRPPEEAMVPGLDRMRTAYLRSLRGEKQAPTRLPLAEDCKDHKKSPETAMDWFRSLFRLHGKPRT